MARASARLPRNMLNSKAGASSRIGLSQIDGTICSQELLLVCIRSLRFSLCSLYTS